MGMCLAEIQKALIKNWSEAHKNFAHLHSRYNSLRKEKNTVGLEFEKYAIHESGLGRALLDLIAKLQEKDFDMTFFLQNEIHQTLTIVANGPDALKKTLTYFDPAIYKSLEPLDISELTPSLKSGPAQLVVLSNLAEFEEDTYKKKCRAYLDDPSKPEALYFGGPWETLKHYADQVYAANSKFSLHARAREMLEYLKSKS
jgi:hypothetical protein